MDQPDEAANQARLQHRTESVTVDEAVSAWRAWSAEQRAQFGRGAGVASVWDDAIVPTITADRTSQTQPAE
jgi:hypothetical protein